MVAEPLLLDADGTERGLRIGATGFESVSEPHPSSNPVTTSEIVAPRRIIEGHMGIVRLTAGARIVAGIDGTRARKVKPIVETVCPAGQELRINYGVQQCGGASMKTGLARKRRGMKPTVVEVPLAAVLATPFMNRPLLRTNTPASTVMRDLHSASALIVDSEPQLGLGRYCRALSNATGRF